MNASMNRLTPALVITVRGVEGLHLEQIQHCRINSRDVNLKVQGTN